MTTVPTNAEALRERALQLWPESEYLQAEWLRAWVVLRSTTRGALLDVDVKRSTPCL